MFVSDDFLSSLILTERLCEDIILMMDLRCFFKKNTVSLKKHFITAMRKGPYAG